MPLVSIRILAFNTLIPLLLPLSETVLEVQLPDIFSQAAIFALISSVDSKVYGDFCHVNILWKPSPPYSQIWHSVTTALPQSQNGWENSVLLIESGHKTAKTAQLKTLKRASTIASENSRSDGISGRNDGVSVLKVGREFWKELMVMCLSL